MGNDSIKFATLLRKDENNYKKLKEFIEQSRTTLPLTAYMGARIMYKEKQLQRIAEDYDLEFMIPQSSEIEGYQYLILKHKVISSKNWFVHFNPVEPILIKYAAKPEYYDPGMITEIPRDLLAKILRGKKKISYRSLPVEVKLQAGCFFDSAKTEMEFMASMIEDIQSELEGDELTEIMHNNSFIDEEENNVLLHSD